MVSSKEATLHRPVSSRLVPSSGTQTSTNHASKLEIQAVVQLFPAKCGMFKGTLSKVPYTKDFLEMKAKMNRVDREV